MMPPEVSVIVTVYNQPIESVFFSLRSVVFQKEVRHEVIVVDDCSRIDNSVQLEGFFRDLGFSSYLIIRNEKNLKTVLSILNAVRRASGDYVKVLGAGDALYSELTLRRICDFMSANNLAVGFGEIVRFMAADGEATANRFMAPLAPESYALPGPERARNRDLLLGQVNKADWIPAGSQFYRRDVFGPCLEKLAFWGVRYCEDFAATAALMNEDTAVAYLNEPVLWYEWGVGISTKPSKESVSRMYLDHSRLYGALRKERPYGDAFLRAAFCFRVRQFVALRTPLYDFLRGLVDKKTRKGDRLLLDRERHSFFFLCGIR